MLPPSSKFPALKQQRLKSAEEILTRPAIFPTHGRFAFGLLEVECFSGIYNFSSWAQLQLQYRSSWPPPSPQIHFQGLHPWISRWCHIRAEGGKSRTPPNKGLLDRFRPVRPARVQKWFAIIALGGSTFNSQGGLSPSPSLVASSPYPTPCLIGSDLASLFQGQLCAATCWQQ